MPPPHFYPVYFGHPGQMGPPPPSPAPEGQFTGTGGQPGMYYQPPNGLNIPSFSQVSYVQPSGDGPADD